MREEREIEYWNIVSSETDPESTDMIQVVTKRVDEGRWLPVRGTSEAPSKLHAKGHNVEMTDIELATNVDHVHFAYFGQELQPGHHKLASGGKLQYSLNLIDKYKEGYYYCCIVNHNGEFKVENLPLTPNLAIERVLQKGKYTISLIVHEAAKETVTLNAAGSLANLIDIEKACVVSDLTIEGSVNFRDLEYIRTAFVNLKRLDMTKSTIVSSQAEGKNYIGNALPEYSLSGLKSLEYIFLPENLESIGDYALASCNLDAIELPASIRQIGSAAFYENPELNAVMVHWTDPITVPSDAFYYTAYQNNGTLYVPLGTRDKYSSADIWSQFNRIEEKEIFDIVAIDYVADGIKYKLMPSEHTASIVGFTASIPEDVVVQESIIYKDVAYTVSSIKTEAFYDCENLHTFKMPNTIKEIGEGAFFSCDNLRTVTISNTLEYIPTCCFCYCYALESADIPKSVKFIGQCAFDTAKSLKNIHIPANTELHPNGAFDGLSSCVSITVDENNPYYVAEDNMLFSKDRKNLILLSGTKEGKIVIPESVERLPWRLFYFMPYITDIQLPSTYTGDIPYQFVSDCPMLKHVAFPDASKKTSTETVTRCETLESLTIGRNLEYGSGIKENPLLKHAFLRNNYRLDLLQVFNDGLYKNMNFYTDRTEPNAILDECEAFYVPGGCKKRFEGIAKCIISEMWQYGIDRNSNMLAIIPAEDYIVIDKVTINGKVVESVNGCFYKFENPDNLDVIVDFTLMGRQSMTTHYDADFMASLPDTDLTKVQKITLDKSDSELYVGQSLKLSAVVTPESVVNKAVEWSSNNPDVAIVDQYGKVTALAAGEATITATATDGSGVSASCKVTVRKPAKGDSNANGTVNIVDAVNTANYAVGIEVENFCFEAADVNEDNRITLSDASGTVTILLESPVEEAVPAMFKVSDKSVADVRDGLVIDDYVAMADRSSSVFVSLDNTTDYVALQADVTVPEGMTLNTVKPGKRIGAGHSLMTRRVDERTMRIALFNPNNVPFANNDEPILELVVKGDNAHSGDIEIRNIIASDAKAGEYRLQSTGGHCLGTTAIGAGKGDGIGIGTGGKAIHIHNAQGQEIAIYSVDGRMVSRFTATSEHESRRVDAGLYIVAVGNETFTLIVK